MRSYMLKSNNGAVYVPTLSNCSWLLKNNLKTFMEFKFLRHLKDINCTNSLVSTLLPSQLQMKTEGNALYDGVIYK